MGCLAHSIKSLSNILVLNATQKGFDELLDAILKELPPTRKQVEFMVPFSAGAFAARVRKEGVVHEEEYRPEGLYMKATADILLIEEGKRFLL